MWIASSLLLCVPLCAGTGGGEKDGAKGKDAKEPSKLERRLREVEKAITAARELDFKGPVRVVFIPGNLAEAKQQAVYSVENQALFILEEDKDSIPKGVLVHEMARALQDQHFDVAGLWKKLRGDKGGLDAEAALAAFIEGDVTFTTIEVMKKEQPKVAAALDLPLEKATDLDNAFLYGQGARYIRALKEKGGWKSVNAQYRFPPQSTASILNLKNVATVDLGPGAAVGAFGLWKKLHELPETRAIALKLAKAWRAGRVVEVSAGKAYLFAMSDPEQAKLLGQTFGKLVGKGPDLFFDFRHQLVLDGNRVTFLTAVGEKSLAHLRDRVFGPLQIQVYSAKAERLISYGEFIEELLKQDIICIGENHDQDLHHRVQLQVIKSLFARDERLGVGLEMFQLPAQKAIERYWAGKTDETGFLKESEYGSRWGFEWALYRPIVEFSRRNGIPLAALNAPRELTGKISKGGWESLEDVDRKLLGPVDFHLKEHREWWFDRLAKMHGDDKTTPERKERGYQVMTTWDDVMGRTAASFHKSQGLRRLVILAGIGHIERGFGIPLRAARLHGANVATVGILINPPGVPATSTGRVILTDRPDTDYVILVRE